MSETEIPKPINKLLLGNLGIIKMSAGQEVYVNFGY